MSKFEEKSSEFSEMGANQEASVLVRLVAEPRPAGDSVKAAIGRAARRVGFTFVRTKNLWYGDARRIDAAEIDTLRRATAQRRDNLDAGRAEARDAITRLSAMRAALVAKDPDFFGPDIASLEHALRAMGCVVGPGTVRD